MASFSGCGSEWTNELRHRRSGLDDIKSCLSFSLRYPKTWLGEKKDIEILYYTLAVPWEDPSLGSVFHRTGYALLLKQPEQNQPFHSMEIHGVDAGYLRKKDSSSSMFLYGEAYSPYSDTITIRPESGEFGAGKFTTFAFQSSASQSNGTASTLENNNHVYAFWDDGEMRYSIEFYNFDTEMNQQIFQQCQQQAKSYFELLQKEPEEG